MGIAIDENIAQTLQNHGQMLREQSATLKRIEVFLAGEYDNPDKPGLVKRVEFVEVFIMGCQERKKEEKKTHIDWVRWIERSVLAVFIVWVLAKFGIKGH